MTWIRPSLHCLSAGFQKKGWETMTDDVVDKTIASLVSEWENMTEDWDKTLVSFHRLFAEFEKLASEWHNMTDAVGQTFDDIAGKLVELGYRLYHGM